MTDQNKSANEQRKLALLQEISLAILEANSIEMVFEEVLGHICRYMGWPLGHIYTWSPQAKALVSSRIWYTADSSAIAPFRELSEATQFKPGEGTLGRVWESGEAILVLDIRQENIFVRQMPIDKQGIRAYYAFPILIDGEASTVLEFFSPESSAPAQDITDLINHVTALLALAFQRQKTIANLKQSEAQLAEAQRTAHVGHWEWDVQENKVTWSTELYRIYGLKKTDFGATYEDFLNHVHPNDLSTVQSKVRDAYENGTPFNYHHNIIRPDGVERTLHSRGRPIYDQSGNIVKLIGTAQDITEHKQAEGKLAKTILRLSALLEIGQSISATLKLDLVYKQILTLIRPLLDAEVMLLFLKNGDALEIVALDRDNFPNIHGALVSLDDGIVGDVWKSGQSVLLQGEECVQRLSPQLKAATRYAPQAIIAVPLRWHDESIGVLQAAHTSPDAFDDEDLEILESAAVWTAIAIGNARQYEMLQRRLNENDAILSISNALTEVFDLDDLLQTIAKRTQDIISHADWTTIHLLHPKTRQLELAASAGLEISPDDSLINSGEGIVGIVIAEGEVINIPDLQANSRQLPIGVSTKARSLLSAPVETQRERIGTLSVQCATPNSFTEDDERVLTIFGIQAGMAIENARLHTVHQKAREKAEKQRKRMQLMARRVVQAQEQERARIARELHDESGQSLTSLKISLDLIRSMLPEEMTDIKASLTDVLDLTDKTMTNLRLLSHNLRPPGLDTFGLDAALAGLCQDFATHTSISVSYNGSELPDLADLTALSLYRVAQEALTNVAKHAKATTIQVTLTQNSDKIALTVVDNGAGFILPNLKESVPIQGAGLLGMVERIEMVDGNLSIDSTPGQGSCLQAFVPYIREEA